MAESAGQITASLTLDISNFKKALSQAQSAVDKMTGRTAGGGGGGGSRGGRAPSIPGADQKTSKAIKETIKNIKNLSSQIKAGTSTTKQASASLKVYTSQLQKLGTGLKRDTEEFRQFNKGLEAATGMKGFIAVSDTASSKMSKLTSQVQSGGSKISTVFAAMSTGGSGAMRATVMSFTNITEAFQKGLMGGRQFAMFFMGDLTDALMIGSFHASAFAKAAAAATGPTKNLLLSMARFAMPAQVALTALMGILGLVASKMGWFGSKAKKAGDETAKATIEFKRAADELTVLESEVSMVGVAFAGFIKRANALEGIDINKALDPMKALVEVSNRLNAIKFGKFGVQILQIGNFIRLAREEVEKLRADFLNLEVVISSGDARNQALEKQREMVAEMKKQAALREQLSDTSNIINAFNIVGQIRDAEEKINELRKARERIVKSGIEDQERLDAIGERIVAQEQILIKAKKDRIKFEKEILKLKKAEKAAEEAKKKKEDPVSKFFTDSMKEAIGQAKILQEKIDSLYEVIKKAPKGEQAGLLESLGVKDAEAQLKKIEKRQAQLVEKGAEVDPKIGIALEDMKHASELQQKMKQDAAAMAKQYEDAKKSIEIASAATEVGLVVTVEEVLKMDSADRKALEKQTERRGKLVDFLAPLVGGTSNAVKAFKMLDKGIKFVADFSLRMLGEKAERFSGAVEAAAEAVKSFGTGLITAAAAMTQPLGQAAMGQFGGFMSGALGALGAGIGAAKGAPEVGQQVGTALGSFADLGISKIEVTSDIVDMETGQLVAVNLMEIIGKEFNEALKPAVDALRPFGNLVFYVATRLGTMLSHLTVALEPLISFIGETLLFAFQFTYVQLSALIPIIAAVANVFSGPLTWGMQWLTGVTRNLGIVFANVAIFLGKFLQDMAEHLGDIPIIGDMARRLGEMGETLTNGAVTFANGLVSSLGDLDPQIRQAANNYARQNQNMEKANREASKVLNAPKGFKVEKYRYEAMNPEQSNPFNSSLNGQTTGNMSVMIEAIYVADGDDLLERLDEAKRTGGFSPLGGN